MVVVQKWATAQEGAIKLTESALVIADIWELEEAVIAPGQAQGKGTELLSRQWKVNFMRNLLFWPWYSV